MHEDSDHTRSKVTKYFFRKFHEKLELAPHNLMLSLIDSNPTREGIYLKTYQLSNLGLYIMFVREIGGALAHITNPVNGEGSFKAKNGVQIRVNFNVCDSPDCSEEDEGQQKVRR